MRMIKTTLLAGALVLALPMGSAMACTAGAWSAKTANASAGNPKGRNSEPAVPRYSGECGLKADAAGSSYVTDNTPSAEGVYRARFYVYTGSATNNPKIFAAYTADSGGGTEVFSINLPSTSTMGFAVNGTTVATTAAIAPQKWYGVEVLYKANGAFTAKVRGDRATTETVVSSAGNAGALTVESVRLGVLNAVSNTVPLAFDAFESTRSEDTEIGRLCPGDANGDGSVGAADAIKVLNEVGNAGAYALGQPDCTEDGAIGSADAICILNRTAVVAQRNCTQR